MSEFRIKKTQELLDSLESQLVKEFRSCQALNTLAIEERLALSRHDVQALPLLSERKTALIDELAQFGQSRRMAVQEAGDVLGLEQPSGEMNDLLESLDPEAARRLGRLYDGILALTEYTRDLSQGNRFLMQIIPELSSQF